MYRVKQLALALGDLLLLYAGLALAVMARYGYLRTRSFVPLLQPMGRLFIAALLIIFIIGLYDVTRARNSWIFYQKIIYAGIVWIFVGIVYFYFYTKGINDLTPKTILVLTAIVGFGGIALWRFIFNRWISGRLGITAVAFIGVTPEIVELIRIFRAEPERGFKVIGLVLADSETLPPEAANLRRAASLNDLAGDPPEIIVVAPHLAGSQDLHRELYAALFRQTSIVDLATFYEQIFNRVPPFIFSENWFAMHLREQEKKIYDRLRILADYVCAIIVGAVFLVTFPIIATAIKLTSPGPIFFQQKRVGRLGKIFTMYKYRTMVALAPDGSAETAGPQFAAKKDYRITPVGKILRRARLDELPQFWNVLKGEMALVGPRPERPEFVEQLTAQMPFYQLRHLIKPGITGWAQIHESYYGNIQENLYKLEFDLYYLKNRGLLLDAIIILRTIDTLVRMAGR